MQRPDLFFICTVGIILLCEIAKGLIILKICHVCGIECDDSQEVCLVCGADLTDEALVEDEEVEVKISEPVLLATFEDVVFSEIFRDILTENKIPYSMGNESGAVQVMFGGGFTADEIYVEKRDFERAEALYNNFMENPPEFSDEDFFEEFDEEIN